MKKKLSFRRSTLFISSIACCILLLVQCTNSEDGKDLPPGGDTAATVQMSTVRTVGYIQFAGSAVCAGCHAAISKSHVHTAHYLTSQPADEKYIRGSFQKDANIFTYNPEQYIAMEKKDSGLYQTLYTYGQVQRSERFDITVGSGTKGQTYAFWKGDRLSELPVSYFTALHQWVNSPGYPGRVVFDRPVTARCMECHSTFAAVTSDAAARADAFNQQQIIYGVDCEKCHGPAARHVAFQTQHPEEKKGQFIVNPAHLSRQQNLDLCGLCHSGRLQKTAPSFSFIAGDTLSHFFAPNTVPSHTADIDVHGNQMGLLSLSKCFQLSEMTCNSCHNSHQNETGQLAVFSQRCMSCHTAAHKPLPNITNKELTANCIDCHMPVQNSKAITFLVQDKPGPVSAFMRTHYITVYAEETKKFNSSQVRSLKAGPF